MTGDNVIQSSIVKPSSIASGGTTFELQKTSPSEGRGLQKHTEDFTKGWSHVVDSTLAGPDEKESRCRAILSVMNVRALRFRECGYWFEGTRTHTVGEPLRNAAVLLTAQLDLVEAMLSSAVKQSMRDTPAKSSALRELKSPQKLLTSHRLLFGKSKGNDELHRQLVGLS